MVVRAARSIAAACRVVLVDKNVSQCTSLYLVLLKVNHFPGNICNSRFLKQI